MAGSPGSRLVGYRIAAAHAAPTARVPTGIGCSQRIHSSHGVAILIVGRVAGNSRRSIATGAVVGGGGGPACCWRRHARGHPFIIGGILALPHVPTGVVDLAWGHFTHIIVEVALVIVSFVGVIRPLPGDRGGMGG